MRAASRDAATSVRYAAALPSTCAVTGARVTSTRAAGVLPATLRLGPRRPDRGRRAEPSSPPRRSDRCGRLRRPRSAASRTASVGNVRNRPARFFSSAACSASWVGGQKLRRRRRLRDGRGIGRHDGRGTASGARSGRQARASGLAFPCAASAAAERRPYLGLRQREATGGEARLLAHAGALALRLREATDALQRRFASSRRSKVKLQSAKAARTSRRKPAFSAANRSRAAARPGVGGFLAEPVTPVERRRPAERPVRHARVRVRLLAPEVESRVRQHAGPPAGPPLREPTPSVSARTAALSAVIPDRNSSSVTPWAPAMGARVRADRPTSHDSRMISPVTRHERRRARRDARSAPVRRGGGSDPQNENAARRRVVGRGSR